MNSFREQCIALRKKGYSLTEIVKITGRAKSSVHTHIKDIPLSEERRRQIRVASGNRIRIFALARKGKSARSFTPFDEWNSDTVSLVAHLVFDGSINPGGGCIYNNRSSSLILDVERCMRIVYDFEPTRYINQLTGVSRISYHNVALGSYMKQKATKLLYDAHKLPIDLKREFIRAFFDDEGCMDYRPEGNKRSVRGYQKDTRILALIQRLLRYFNIESRIILPNEVVIVGKENLIRFEKEINFSDGVCMNGNRSNSRWKKNMEKRELLKQAIASFKISS